MEKIITIKELEQKVNTLKQEVDSITNNRFTTDKLLTEQTILINSTIIKTGQSIRSFLLAMCAVDIKKAGLNVEAKRDGLSIIIHPDDYRIRYEIEINYNIVYDTNEPYIIINPSGRSYGKEHALSYKIAGLILIDVSEKGEFYQQIMSSFAYLQSLILHETSLSDQLKQWKQAQELYIDKLNYAEFDLKLQPLNVLITHQKLPLIIHRVTAHTVLVSSSTNSIDKHAIGEKFKIFKSSLYTQCTRNWEPWRVLTKAEYVEEFI